jgi:hypothetical protein
MLHPDLILEDARAKLKNYQREADILRSLRTNRVSRRSAKDDEEKRWLKRRTYVNYRTY